jgi:L-alanine-DL-glutamate epimerase-like enolase superfamily enzyme
LHAHLVAAIPNGRYVEYFPDDKVLNFRRLLTRQMQVEKGRLALPKDPGLGFDFDPQAVERYAVGPWSH